MSESYMNMNIDYLPTATTIVIICRPVNYEQGTLANYLQFYRYVITMITPSRQTKEMSAALHGPGLGTVVPCYARIRKVYDVD